MLKQLKIVYLLKNKKFMVRTDGADGKLHDYEIKYTFGVAPLQQYLIEIEQGRLQALYVLSAICHQEIIWLSHV